MLCTAILLSLLSTSPSHKPTLIDLRLNTVLVDGSSFVGNGFFLKRGGYDTLYFVTAAHVLVGADMLGVDIVALNTCDECILESITYSGLAIYTSKESDTAIIKIVDEDGCLRCLHEPVVGKDYDYGNERNKDVFTYTYHTAMESLYYLQGYIAGTVEETSGKWVVVQPVFDFGFSGAPVYKTSTNELVGMYVSQRLDACTTVPEAECKYKLALFRPMFNIYSVLDEGIIADTRKTFRCIGHAWCK